MLTVSRPAEGSRGARLGGLRQRGVPAVVAAVGASGALAALVVVSATTTWGLVPAAQVPVDATVGVTFSVMAAVVLTSPGLRSGSRALAWVLMTAGVCSGLAALTTALSLAAGSATRAAGVAVQLQGAIWVPGFLPLLTLVPLLYPDGLLPGRLWRWAAVAAALGTTTLTAAMCLFPETFEGQVAIEKPVSNLPAAQLLTAFSAALLLPAAAAALACQVVRFRRADGLRRRQVVVLMAAAAVLAAVTAAQTVLPRPVDVVAQALAAGLVAVAIGVAVTRHGLYDLDTAVARSVVAASLGVCLAGAYLTLFAVLQALPRHQSALSAALAAGLTGAVMQPLAKRLTAGVDRMYYGDRTDPFAVTSELAARLTSSGLDVALVPQVVCDTVVETLRLTAATIRLADDGPRSVASAGPVPSERAPASFDLRHRGEVVGELDVWPRAGERVLHQRDEVVLRGVADQASPAVAALRLHQQLQRSREALVSAREGERLQLRRDLHDGLGATLAGLRLQVETARDLTDDPGIRRLLGAAGDGVAHAITEVRSITEGLRPAGIDELGLGRALSVLADRVRTPDLQVQVDVDSDLHTDPAVEVALHRIAAEALANVVSHARATTVRLAVHDSHHLTLDVVDDGIGLADAGSTAGSGLGLDSMRRRAEEVGGRLEISSSSRGTHVRAVLPHSVGDLR